MQIVEALKNAQQQLNLFDSAKLDAEILLCSVLNCERPYVYAHPEQELSNKEIGSFNKLIPLRAEGQPVAHLINHKEFWSLSLHITKDTLIPRPETEFLVEKVLNIIPSDLNKKILDMGTGSGAIAIAIASERPLANLTATDNSDAAIKVAKQNADTHKIENIKFIKADWFENENIKTYDLIVSNPPYIENNDPHLKQGDVRYEPISALASGKDGLDDLRIIIRESKNHLSQQGWLLVEHGYNQGEAVKQLFIENGYVSLSTLKDYSGNDRISIGQLYP